MPTIREILAAKQAAQAAVDALNGTPPADAPAAPDSPSLTLAERAELKEAIDRIDPPGEARAAASRAARAGLVLSRRDPDPCPNGEPRGQETPVDGPPQRALSLTSGEEIDMTPVGADPATAAWHQAATALESELVVMRDPNDPEACWLALAPIGGRLMPLLLHRLPWTLWDYPHPRPENEPF